MLRRSHALCSLLLQASVAAAQGPVLGGQAVDSASGDPQPAIVVFAQGDTSQIAAKTVTDDRGLFVLPLPGPGIYRLIFSKQCRRALYGPVDTLSGDTTVQHKYLLNFTAFPADSVFTFAGLEAPAKRKIMREPLLVHQTNAENAHGEGLVELEFVVDTTGKVEPTTVRVLKNTDFGFTTAIINALSHAEYEPAKVCGQHFRQRVQEKFQFKMAYRTPGLP